MVAMVDDLRKRNVFVDNANRNAPNQLNVVTDFEVPETIQQLIEQQYNRLSVEEQKVLEVASVAGMVFSAAVVAAGCEAEVTTGETCCTQLARYGQFLRTSGISEWPDGTVAACYEFLHALYQEVIYQRLSVSQLTPLHQRIGKRLEVAYGQRSREIAAELAAHFERGREYRKAIQYLQQAGENAAQRSAYQEATSHLTKGLELLKILPDTPERVQQELTLQLALGAALIPGKGYTASEVEKTATRARALCQQLGETPQLFPVLGRLVFFYIMRGDLRTARELAEQMMRLAQSAQDRYLLSLAHAALGGTLFFLGELTSARTHLEQRSCIGSRERLHFSLVSRV
jgi:predicted ATPase